MNLNLFWNTLCLINVQTVGHCSSRIFNFHSESNGYKCESWCISVCWKIYKFLLAINFRTFLYLEISIKHWNTHSWLDPWRMNSSKWASSFLTIYGYWTHFGIFKHFNKFYSTKTKPENILKNNSNNIHAKHICFILHVFWSYPCSLYKVI